MGKKMTRNNEKVGAVWLITSRKELRLSMADMARRLRTPYGTYVKWERGDRPIPGVLQTAVELLLKHDALVMQAINELCSKP
jgi:DNA-binding transcriptional regulator YiaG